MKTELRECLIEHAALLPPTESTHALHESIHSCNQTEDLEPPRPNSFYMFECMNGHLNFKHMFQNKSYPTASTVKAYAKEEFITQAIGFKSSCLITVIDNLVCCLLTTTQFKKYCLLFQISMWTKTMLLFFAYLSCSCNERRMQPKAFVPVRKY